MFRNVVSLSAVMACAAVVSAAEPLVMVKHTVRDVARNNNQPLGTLLVPKGWKAENSIVWDLHSAIYPFTMKQKYTAPDGSMAVEFHSDLGNVIIDEEKIKDVRVAMQLWFQANRPGAKNARIVKSDASKWAKEAHGHLQLGTMVVSYTLGNREIEEEVAANLFVSSFPAGDRRISMGYLGSIRSVIANKGELAQARAIGVAMQRSATSTPEFAYAIDSASMSYVAVARHNIQQTIEDGKMYRKMNQETRDQWQKVVDQRWEAGDRQAEQFRDLMGGVNRFTSTAGHTVVLPQSHKYAWEGPNNTYILTDDPSWKPDYRYSGNWNQLKPKN